MSRVVKANWVVRYWVAAAIVLGVCLGLTYYGTRLVGRGDLWGSTALSLLIWLPAVILLFRRRRAQMSREQ